MSLRTLGRLLPQTSRFTLRSASLGMTSRFYSSRRFSKQHEWVDLDGEGVGTVGVTDFAQKALGDFVFVELPEVGSEVEIDDPIGVVESVKAASDIYAPFGGEIVEVNETLTSKPGQVNRDPYGKGWLCKIKLADRSQYNALLDEAAYNKFTEE